MDIQDLGAVGEFAGALLLFASLIYIGIQIKQSNDAASVEARQTVLNKFSEAKNNIIASTEARLVLTKGLTDFDSLEQDEALLFTLVFGVFGDNCYNALRLRDEGILDEESFQYISNAFVGGFSTQGGASYWKWAVSHLGLPSSFVNHINNRPHP